MQRNESNTTIEQFENCWFNKDYSEIQKEDFDVIFTRFLDISKSFSLEEAHLLSHIYHIKNRITCVDLFIAAQKLSIVVNDKPSEEHFDLMKPYGYTLTYNGSHKNFLEQLESLEAREARFQHELKSKLEIYEKRKTKMKKNSDEDEKLDFKMLIIRLQHNGYFIDKSKTTVEELALIIKDVKSKERK